MRKAAALKYHPGLPAPFVIAKGKDELAQKLIDIAEKNNVPITESDALSETLVSLDIGQFIPEDLYQIVADLLVTVYEVQENL